jgi:hypothetical protein
MMPSDAEHNDKAGRAVVETSLAEVVVARLTALEAGQNVMNGALGLMLDTLQAQTNLLRRLHEYAKDEPAESPVTKILGELTGAIMELDASIDGMEKKFDRLAGTIIAAFEIDETGHSPPTINGGSS